MCGEKFYMAISGRVRDNNKWRYFTGYFIDTENNACRFDLKLVERPKLDFESRLKTTTIKKYKILAFTKRQHIKDFQRQSVEKFNQFKELNRYYNFKAMLKGYFVHYVGERGLDVKKIDPENFQFITGEIDN